MSNNVEENEEDIIEIDDNLNDQDSFDKSTISDAGSSNSNSQIVATTTASETIPPSIAQQEQNTKPISDSKFFAIRTTGGQEHVVANILQNKVNTKKIGIRSILVLDTFKGYIIVEAPDSNVAYEALAGIRHARGQIRGELPFKDIEGYLVKKPVVSELNIDDTVEVIAGPFKAMKAKITRVDYEKQEATVVLLDSPYQIPVTVDANYLKKVLH
jgi:transcription termination/antitermination protein NusG